MIRRSGIQEVTAVYSLVMATPALACSFCGRNQNEVSRLVAGQRAIICNDCVRIAKRAMAAPTPDLTPSEGWFTPRPDDPKD